MAFVVMEDQEGIGWLNSLSRADEAELLAAVCQQAVGAGAWQIRETRDRATGELLSREEVFIRIDPLGDWIEDHGGRREWSDQLVVVGVDLNKGDGMGKSFSGQDMLDAVKVDHCGMDRADD